MAIRKTRRQLVMDAGSIAALYASGWGPKLAPVVEAPPVVKSATLEHAEYLVALIKEWEQKAGGSGPDAAEAASILASVDRCLDLPCDCLDGAFARRVLSA